MYENRETARRSHKPRGRRPMHQTQPLWLTSLGRRPRAHQGNVCQVRDVLARGRTSQSWLRLRVCRGSPPGRIQIYRLFFSADLEVVASALFGLVLGAVGCASWTVRVAIRLERKVSPPSPNTLRVFRCFGPLSGGPEQRKTLKIQSRPGV